MKSALMRPRPAGSKKERFAFSGVSVDEMTQRSIEWICCS